MGWPALRGKWDWAEALLRARPGEKGVVFVRYVRLSDVICERLRAAKLSSINSTAR